MMVWKHCLSMAQRRQSVAALMVAVLLQLYKIASSPNTLPGAIVLRYLFSRETSTLPSENKNIELESKQKEKNGGGDHITITQKVASFYKDSYRNIIVKILN